MERYNVPAWKRTLFTRPEGYRALPRDTRRGLSRVPAAQAYYAGEMLTGVYAIEDCDGCGQSMVPVFDIRPHGGMLHARCVTCEAEVLLERARRAMPKQDYRTKGINVTHPAKARKECCYCGDRWTGRGLACEKPPCKEAHEERKRAKNAERTQGYEARRSYAKRFNLEPGEPGPDCMVCGEPTGMTSAYANLVALHGGIKRDKPGTARGWSFSRLTPGSCEHAYLAQGGMYVTAPDGTGVRRAGISEEDEQKIIELWHQVNEEGDR